MRYYQETHIDNTEFKNYLDYHLSKIYYDQNLELYIKNIFFDMTDHKRLDIKTKFKNIMKKDLTFEVYDNKPLDNDFTINLNINNAVKNLTISKSDVTFGTFEKKEKYIKRTFNSKFLVNNYNPSKGEFQMIFTLILMESNKNILLMDEPCNNIHIQFINNFSKKIIENNNQQIYLITHRPEFINHNTCQHLLFFKQQDNSIEILTSKNIGFDEKSKKILIEMKDIFFTNDILLVEGWDDVKIITRVLEFFINFNETKKNIPNYYVLDIKGCRSNIWSILNKLGHNYKIIYDYDVIFNRNTFCPKIDEYIKMLRRDYKNNDYIKKIKDNIKESKIKKDFLDNFFNKNIINYDISTIPKLVVIAFIDVFDKHRYIRKILSKECDKYIIDILNKENIKFFNFNNLDDNGIISFDKLEKKDNIKIKDLKKSLKKKIKNQLYNKINKFNTNNTYNMDDFKIKDLYDYVDEFIQKITDFKIDESEIMMKLKEMNIFIWNSKIKTIEGFIEPMIKKIYPDINITHGSISGLDDNKIVKSIYNCNKNQLSYEFKLLYDFLSIDKI